MHYLNDHFFLLIAGLFFLAVFFAIEGLLMWWNATSSPEAKRLARRLQSMSAGGAMTSEQASLLKQRLMANSTPIQKVLLSIPRLASFDKRLNLSGLGWTVAKFATITFVIFGLSFFTLGVFGLAFGSAVIFAAILALLPHFYVSSRITKRLKRFEELLPDTMDLISRALRAGHALPTSIKLAGDEMPDPIGPEFQQTFDEVNYGVDLSAALQNLGNRVPSTDLNFFVIAVLIQRETGGNLGEILGNISRVIRDRLTLLGKVKALSAEGRMSAWILSLLPFFTAAMIYTLNPETMSLLWTEKIGRIISVVGMVFIVVGIFWIRAVVRIKV